MDYDALAQQAVLDLLDREHAAIWLEIEAKLADRPHPLLPGGINPHHLTTARRQLTQQQRIEQIAAITLDARAIAGICQALANGTRLAMLRELFQGRRSTADLMAAVGIDRGPLYHHLRDLFVQGLIAQPERGSYILTGRGVSILLAVSLLPTLGEPIEQSSSSSLELDEDGVGNDTPPVAPAG